MNNSMDRAPYRHLLLFFIFPFSFFLSQGCASTTTTLTLKPTNGDIAYAQKFAQTYAGKTPDGSWSVVMVADESSPASPSALRQIVHVKILWRPLSGTGHQAACANAAIDWYILSNSTGADDLLLYQGCGYVAIDPGDSTTKVTIRAASLRPSMNRGNLADPLGEAQLSGRFIARNDQSRLRQILAETRTRTAAIASSSQ